MINYNDGTTEHSPNLERARTDVRKSGTLGAVNAEVVLALNGESNGSFDIRGTFSASVVVEAADDSGNYTIIPHFNRSTEQFQLTATAAGNFDIPNISAFRLLRIRCSAFTSGAIVTSLNASLAPTMVYAKPIPTLLSLTATAAAGSAATLTLPAAGTSAFHYITRLRISKYCAAALTPAAAPTIATTTNLNNNPSFDFKTLGAQGDSEVMDIDFTGNPLKANAANTTTVFTCPILAGAIWKITAFYYTGA